MSTFIMLIPIIIVLILVMMVVFLFRKYYFSQAVRFSYKSRSEYLRAKPVTDDEKKDATNQLLVGIVICMLSQIFLPLLLIGIVPLFVGGRKILYLSIVKGEANNFE